MDLASDHCEMEQSDINESESGKDTILKIATERVAIVIAPS